MRPFLILQIRPFDDASDDEFKALLKYGGLKETEAHRVRMEQNGIPEINLDDYSGIIVGGGPSNVSDSLIDKSEAQKRFEADLNILFDKVFNNDFPFLGICYGMGALAKHQGGEVSKELYGESVGAIDISMTAEGQQDKLLKGLPTVFMAYCGHKEACQNLTPGATLLASSTECPSQMIRFQSNIYATQFHVELDEAGIKLRIEAYKNHGYFNPEDAQFLIDKMADANVIYPSKILRRFVDSYKR
ncbi:MAG: glutamine amidotransferase [Bacteroidia bacterium]|nr:glutamine amidotransferase [Bacteroidia bacterium]MBT8268497.1 glutamine amidotransferase [Bacteroidia bacterium]NNF81292.1 glutamine amidotransferase [Flavobacteriaceae bacterium]NNK69741.1 glutamine amidotransferase [Flavobacteriaceae bacterium]NNL80694.1 glutamine amidotransferase [Flavobacteriaceae bacterium]